MAGLAVRPGTAYASGQPEGDLQKPRRLAAAPREHDPSGTQQLVRASQKARERLKQAALLFADGEMDHEGAVTRGR
jgi:hypothetical protein